MSRAWWLLIMAMALFLLAMITSAWKLNRIENRISGVPELAVPAFQYDPETRNLGSVCPGERHEIRYWVKVSRAPLAAKVTTTIWPSDRSDLVLRGQIRNFISDDTPVVYHYPYPEDAEVIAVFEVPDIPPGRYDRIVMAEFNGSIPASYRTQFVVRPPQECG